jgi:hypothetical protein
MIWVARKALISRNSAGIRYIHLAGKSPARNSISVRKVASWQAAFSRSSGRVSSSSQAMSLVAFHCRAFASS